MTIKVLRFLFLSLCFAVFAASIAAQPPAAATADAKAALYKKWYVNRDGNADQQAAAAGIAREYIGKFGAVDDQYTKAVKAWNLTYEKAVADYNFRLSVSQKKYADAFRSGKEILKNEPERLDVLLGLSFAGMQAALDDLKSAFNADAETSSLKAIELIKAGKEPLAADAAGMPVVNWFPYVDKEAALGALNYTVGFFKLNADKPREAVSYLHAAAAGRSKFARATTTYLYLGTAYQTGDYKILLAELKAAMEKPVSEAQIAESKAKLEKLNPYLDRMIDAYARFLALTLNLPNDAAKQEVTQTLTQFYKFRHNNSDAGLKEYIEKVLSQPIPAPPLNR